MKNRNNLPCLGNILNASDQKLEKMFIMSSTEIFFLVYWEKNYRYFLVLERGSNITSNYDNFI